MPAKRPRRLRRSETLRNSVREVNLRIERLVYPVFVKDGIGQEAISSMPGQFRWGIEELVVHLTPLYEKGLRSFAVFPVIAPELKDDQGREALNEKGLACKTLRRLRSAFPKATLFADVALDPYTTHGHDGLVENEQVVNDPSVAVLARQAVVLAAAGADFVCPSDMMDGRVAAIRAALDENGFSETGILSYCAKYASAFYGPFRGALNSAPRFGDKKTYQMDPGNRREALRELKLDLQEGADIVMVKPAGFYLDVIADFKARSPVPVAAYQVSGEYSMIMAAVDKGWLDRHAAVRESLLAIHRAGADLIFTYFAPLLAESI